MNTDQLPTIDTADATLDEAVTTGSSHLGPHRFDPVSAVFGLLACFAGVLVTTGTVDPAGGDDAVVWVAAMVIAAGVAILPWGSRRGS